MLERKRNFLNLGAWKRHREMHAWPGSRDKKIYGNEKLLWPWLSTVGEDEGGSHEKSGDDGGEDDEDEKKRIDSEERRERREKERERSCR
jgi:transposase-like protein